MQDPTRRFSDRASYYAKFRPTYPEELLAYLRGFFPLPAVVADIGSGTGILTRQLLDHGYIVYAVEPNEPMRAEAERALKTYSGFHSVIGRAEATAEQIFAKYEYDGKVTVEYETKLYLGRWGKKEEGGRRN